MILFILGILFIASIDCIFGFSLYLLWRYLDLKYFSTSEIEQLKTENKYLKEENKKVNGVSSDFYGKDFNKLWYLILKKID